MRPMPLVGPVVITLRLHAVHVVIVEDLMFFFFIIVIIADTTTTAAAAVPPTRVGKAQISDGRSEIRARR